MFDHLNQIIVQFFVNLKVQLGPRCLLKTKWKITIVVSKLNICILLVSSQEKKKKIFSYSKETKKNPSVVDPNLLGINKLNLRIYMYSAKKFYF